MQGGLDYIMLKTLNMDGIRIIGRVLSQSIALDHYIHQVCCRILIRISNALIFCSDGKLIPSCLLGWWDGGRVCRNQPWFGEDWNFYYETETAFQFGVEIKFKSDCCYSQTWAFWEVMFVLPIINSSVVN